MGGGFKRSIVSQNPAGQPAEIMLHKGRYLTQKGRWTSSGLFRFCTDPIQLIGRCRVPWAADVGATQVRKVARVDGTLFLPSFHFAGV